MNEYISMEEARKQIVEYGRRLYERGFAAANDGNLSCRIAEDEVLCTPTGVSKGYMTPEMLVHMKLDGTILSGGVPSSEAKMHLRVYLENPAIMAVVHLHPPVSTSFAAAGIPLDQPLLTEAIAALGTVPVAPFALPSTEEVPNSIADISKTHNGALLRNHGPITWGTTLKEACFRMEILEQLATATLNVCYIMKQPGKQISDENIARLQSLVY